MTGAHDETDAAFVERMDKHNRDAISYVCPLAQQLDKNWRRLIDIAARAHAAPRTVQAAVTEEGAIRELVMLIAEEHGGLPGDACANERDQEPTSTNITEDGDIVPGKITFGHIRRAYAALESAASVPTGAPRTVPEPTSPAACSCGGVAWQPIETAPKDDKSVLVWAADHGQMVARRCFQGWIFQWGFDDWVSISPTHWMPLPTDPGATPSTPCACYRAGLERAAKIAEDAAFARAIASDIRRAGEEGSR